MKKKKVVKKAKKKIVKKPVKKALKPKKKKITKKAVAKKEKPGKATSISEGVSLEEVGVVTHYFPKVDAAVVKMTKGSLSSGDTIFIKGHTSDFKEKAESMQLDHVPIQVAEIGQEIGLKVKSKVREHDIIYKAV